MKKYTIPQKRALLVRLIELYIFCGYGIADTVGRPFSYFNFEKVEETIARLETEKELINT